MKSRLFSPPGNAFFVLDRKNPYTYKSFFHKILVFGILLASFLFMPQTHAQQTLNVTGGTGTIGGDVFSYSIGEMLLVSTASTSNFYFTQGLLQNDDVNLKIHNSQYLSEGLEIYPNPVADVVFLQASFEDGGQFELKLYDLRGRMVGQKQAVLHTGKEKQQMDISMLQSGTYLLQAILKQDGQVYRHSFKLLKRKNK
jgi:hypothetical protein